MGKLMEVSTAFNDVGRARPSSSDDVALCSLSGTGLSKSMPGRRIRKEGGGLGSAEEEATGLGLGLWVAPEGPALTSLPPQPSPQPSSSPKQLLSLPLQHLCFVFIPDRNLNGDTMQLAFRYNDVLPKTGLVRDLCTSLREEDAGEICDRGDFTELVGCPEIFVRFLR
ncbi:hypothetical protein BDY24DRAFT_259837 [Mrakia frigida]|uniref:uncharacterized protein n=1 Tax=Mrakia frigida TaxID=29902 RepID=UPI003FCC102B